jgi:hypothetical protein
VDNGPEFISEDVYLWAYWDHVTLDFSRAGSRRTTPISSPSTTGSVRNASMSTGS